MASRSIMRAKWALVMFVLTPPTLLNVLATPAERAQSSSSLPYANRDSSLSDETKDILEDATDTFKKIVERRCSDLSKSKTKAGVLRTTITGLKLKKATCLKIPGLTEQKLRILARLLFHDKKYALRSVTCEFGRPHSRKIGGKKRKGCKVSSSNYALSLSKMSSALVASGASIAEASATLEHFRALSTSMKVCFPRMYKLDLIFLPTAYHHLYEIYNAKLLSRLVAEGRLLTSTRDLSPVLRNLKRKKVYPRSQLVDILVERVLGATSSSLSVAKNSRDASHFQAKHEHTLDTSIHTKDNDKNKDELTEEGCNKGVEQGKYMVWEMEKVKEPFENCCASSCFSLLDSSRQLHSSSEEFLDICCKGCNRFSCKENTPEESSQFANSALIVSPAKELVSDPTIYTIVV